jgi:hypothetical protein
MLLYFFFPYKFVLLSASLDLSEIEHYCHKRERITPQYQHSKSRMLQWKTEKRNKAYIKDCQFINSVFKFASNNLRQIQDDQKVTQHILKYLSMVAVQNN